MRLLKWGLAWLALSVGATVLDVFTGHPASHFFNMAIISIPGTFIYYKILTGSWTGR